MDIMLMILLKAEALQLTLLFVLMQAASSKQQDSRSERGLSLIPEPAAIAEVLEDTNHEITFNCTIGSETLKKQQLYFVITSKQKRVALPYRSPDAQNTSMENEYTLSMPIDCQKNPYKFGVYANTVGRTVLLIKISHSPQTKALYSRQMSVSVVRNIRMPDIVFDCVMPVIMLLISFSVGCTTDSDALLMYRDFKQPIALGIACQFIIIPLLSLCVTKIAFNEPDMGLGLLLVATIPGGGSGHLMVAVLEADLPLSYMLNFSSYALATVIAPLWIVTVGRLVKDPGTTIPYGQLIFWLSCSFASYLLGLGLRRKSENVAEAFLNWLTKPCLLFAAILFVSLGLYINFYTFNVLELSSLFGISLFPCLSYGIGYLLPCAVRQVPEYTKTISTEAAMPNSVVALVIAQYILNQPACDIASIAPMYVLVVCPLPFILEYLFKLLLAFVKEKCAKRKEVKNQNFRIAASTSLLNVTHTTQLESSSFVSNRNDFTEHKELEIVYNRPSTSDKITTL